MTVRVNERIFDDNSAPLVVQLIGRLVMFLEVKLVDTLQRVRRIP